ncbi:tetratricopeptide repeat protein [Blastomonas fulva]|uniref:tetratricopeptide repeat protein n=1 Tax=Blastomonas fulva TaxID=1550728 RepID=UPI0025A3C14D|nr:tetratricopeptide repeat protein [Blastomonas fulva]MDM7928419.1 tetratricopeptide repeat protein [Blastomonas fulva]MDM7967105.1 tetratricopeptide repeat protein [Blastomonas fulva]
MALTPNKDADAARDNMFMREVDDALRQDQMAGIVQNYGKIILIGIVVVLLALGGWFYYRHATAEAAGERGEELTNALDAVRNNNLSGAANALKPLETADQPGYRAVSQLLAAGIAQEQDNPKAAAATFAKVAADESLPQPLRDLALIRQTAAEYDSLKPADVIARLKPLAVPGNPWFGSAGEMVAIAHMRMNKPDLAGPLFLQLSEDKQVPETIRSRSRQLAGVMGVDAVSDPSKAQGVAEPVTAAGLSAPTAGQ